ncbi:MAG: PilN domain-containing protein [Planctomycetes bacterium]|nr:PilN domain-containing protein [Planctomycetota bacterium]
MSAPILIFERTPDGVRAALVRRVMGEVEVVASASGADFASARLGLPRRLPSAAWVVEPRVFVACLELPPRGSLPPERLAGLVRYELEPLAPSEGPLRCAAADLPGSSLLGAALPEAAWRENEQELRSLSLDLAGCLPSLGAGIVLAPAPGQLLETSSAGLATARLGPSGELLSWEGGAQLTREDVIRDVDPEMPLTVLAETALEAESFAPDVHLAPPAGLSPATWAGAHRALGLAHGERIPALVGATRSSWERVAGLLPLAWVAVFALAFGGGELALRARRVSLTQTLSHAQAQANELRRAKATRSAARAALDAKRIELQRLEVLERGVTAADQRGATVALLLSALSTHLPAEVSLQSLREEGGSLSLNGFSLDSAAVSRLSRDLGRALEPTGLRPLPARVRATVEDGVPGYRFVLDLRRTRGASSSTGSVTRTLQAGAQVGAVRTLRLPAGRHHAAGGSR